LIPSIETEMVREAGHILTKEVGLEVALSTTSDGLTPNF